MPMEDVQKTHKTKKILFFRGIALLVTLVMALSTVYVLIRMAGAPVNILPGEASQKTKADFASVFPQCVAGTVFMCLALLLEKKTRLSVPPALMTFFSLFIFAAYFLGKVCSFYTIFYHWDTFLHLVSGVGLCALGYSVAAHYVKAGDGAVNYLFAAAFAFCFAMALGGLWEIIEFAIDCLTHSNSQIYALPTGEPLIGQAALADTMKDLITDAAGALIAVLAKIFSVRRVNMGNKPKR